MGLNTTETQSCDAGVGIGGKLELSKKRVMYQAEKRWKKRRKAVYTEGEGPVCKCTGQCTLEGSVQGGG